MSRALYHLSYTAGGSAGGRMPDSDDIGTDAGGRSGCGGWIRTSDLRVMSPTSFHCSTPPEEHTAPGAPSSRGPGPRTRPQGEGVGGVSGVGLGVAVGVGVGVGTGVGGSKVGAVAGTPAKLGVALPPGSSTYTFSPGIT